MYHSDSLNRYYFETRVKIMNRLLKILLFMLVSVNIFGNTDPCVTHNSVFQSGEELTYKLYYNWGYIWLSAGEVNFKVTETSSTYIFEARGKTYKSYEWFFKVDDYFRSEVDKKTLLPIEFERSVEEGNYRFYNKTHFNQDNKSATSQKGRTKDNLTSTEHVFKQCMHDVLSSIYYLRNVNYSALNTNDKIPLKMFLDDGTYPIDVEFRGVKNRKIRDLGKHQTFQLSPELVEGEVFSSDQKMNVWVSNDSNKIPLLIESPVSVGSVKAVLIKHKGLKYELQSKV